ncbi:MAG: AroM family protein [Deltaproteobacteria bacterium]|nr:AroM family protein [Deltaproteobacteria bacterium]MBW2305771.1 AroM family protein [Deltaproteobacteria bacterium]
MNILLPLLQKKVSELEQKGVDIILVMYKGNMSALVSRKPLFIPHRVFTGAIGWMQPKGPVGIICPVEGQRRAAEKKWREAGFDPVVLIASPFCDTDMREAGFKLQNKALDMVIIDCYGHGEMGKKELTEMLRCPVISMRSMVVKILSEILG